MTAEFPVARRRTEIAALLGLLVVCALVYSPVWKNDFVNFDDDLFIYQNELIRSLDASSIARLFELQILTPHYKPLVYLSWAVEYRLFGLDPRAYHLNNLLLHLTNTVLVYWLLRTLAGFVPNAGRWAVLAATALFALHPMRVESVAWATERKDVLFAFFFLASLASYSAWVGRRRRSYLAASALFFVLGTLSKAAIVTLPATLLLVDYLHRRRDFKVLILDKAPFALIVVLALACYGLLFPAVPDAPVRSPEALLTAAVDPAAPDLPAAGVHVAAAGTGDWSPARQVIAAGYRVLGFTGHLLWPRNLAVIYAVPEALGESPSSAAVAGVLGLLAAAAGLAVYGLAKAPAAGAGALFYLVTLLPALAAPVYGTNFLSDRYTYLPSIGLGVVLVATLVATAARAVPALRAALPQVAALYLVGLTVTSYRQVGVWHDSQSLWTAAIERRGETTSALNNRGVALQEAGDLPAAIEDFDRALDLDPFHFRAYNNRALVRHAMDQFELALEDLDRSIALQGAVALLYRNRGVVAVDAGRVVSGIRDYSQAIALEPTDAEPYLLRGVARRLLGDLDGAVVDFDRSLELGGHDREALLQRGAVRILGGDFAGAVGDNTAVLELDPGDAQALNNRGFARFFLGQFEAALDDLDRAIRLEPAHALAYRNRGDVHAAQEDFGEACSDWRVAEHLGAPESAERVAEFCPDPG